VATDGDVLDGWWDTKQGKRRYGPNGSGLLLDVMEKPRRSGRWAWTLTLGDQIGHACRVPGGTEDARFCQVWRSFSTGILTFAVCALIIPTHSAEPGCWKRGTSLSSCESILLAFQHNPHCSCVSA
jgi:hypothetical protein